MKQTQSPKYKLNKVDMIKVGKGAGIAMLGAIATIILESVGQIDFGEYTPIVVAINSILTNLLYKTLNGPAKE